MGNQLQSLTSALAEVGLLPDQTDNPATSSINESLNNFWLGQNHRETPISSQHETQLSRQQKQAQDNAARLAAQEEAERAQAAAQLEAVRRQIALLQQEQAQKLIH